MKLEDVLSQFQVTQDQLLSLMQLEEGDIAYVSGSVIEGFGNPHSDLDLFVLKPTIDHVEAQFIYARYRIQIQIIQNKRFDVEYHRFADLEALLKLARDFNVDNLNHMESLDPKTIDFLHRLRIALPLYGEKELRSAQTSIHVENLCASLKNWRIRSYNAHLMDCTGMLAIGDLDTAVLWARQTLCDAVDVCLAVHLDTNPTEKWRSRKIERNFGKDSELYKDYHRLMWQEVTIENREAYIRQLLSFASDLILEAQLKTDR